MIAAWPNTDSLLSHTLRIFLAFRREKTLAWIRSRVYARRRETATGSDGLRHIRPYGNKVADGHRDEADWDRVAKFLSKFSRDTFNAEGLLTDAENSRYRQAMIDKLVRVLRAPAEDESFMKWLTIDIYRGKRTESVLSRMGELAEDAVEPALLRVMGDEIIDRLKERMRAIQNIDIETDYTAQAWFKISDTTLSERLRTTMISQGMMCYGADPASADARHYGRLAGLTNHKGQYEDTCGQAIQVL